MKSTTTGLIEFQSSREKDGRWKWRVSRQRWQHGPKVGLWEVGTHDQMTAAYEAAFQQKRA